MYGPPGGLVFVGAVLVGVGIGMAVGNVGAGAVIGTGIGFILMAIVTPAARLMKRFEKERI